MFALAWIFLADQPAYRTGVIIVGLARCIAMVLIWNDIAHGDRERAAVLVVFNALFQVAAYSLLGYFYLTVLPGWLGLDTQGFEVGIWEVARTVLIFLGIPLAAGFLTRRIGIRRRGRDWYEQRFIPRVAPITLYGLLFTIVLLFAIQGDTITSQPLDVALIAVPLLVYFAIMWVAGFAAGTLMGFPYPQTAALSFTVASNDFELAIAVAVGVFGANLGRGARRRGRPADRGARARRARLRRTLAAPPPHLATKQGAGRGTRVERDGTVLASPPPGQAHSDVRKARPRAGVESALDTPLLFPRASRGGLGRARDAVVGLALTGLLNCAAGVACHRRRCAPLTAARGGRQLDRHPGGKVKRHRGRGAYCSAVLASARARPRAAGPSSSTTRRPRRANADAPSGRFPARPSNCQPLNPQPLLARVGACEGDRKAGRSGCREGVLGAPELGIAAAEYGRRGDRRGRLAVDAGGGRAAPFPSRSRRGSGTP